MDYSDARRMADPSSGDRQNALPYEEIRRHLCVDMVNTQSSADLLAKAPHTGYEDMSMVYRVLIRNPQGESGRALITNELMERMGVTREQLHEDALANSPLVRPAVIKDIREVLGLVLDDGTPLEMCEPQMYVVTTTDMVWGCGAIFYPGFMDQCTETVGGGYYILPSSIHEVLLYPEDGGVNAKELQELVTNINAMEVAPEDRLSNSVYHYDPKERLFELGAVFEERRDALDAAALDGKDAEQAKPTSVLSDLHDRQKDAGSRSRPAPTQTQQKSSKNRAVL